MKELNNFSSPAVACSFVDSSANETPGPYWMCPKGSLPTRETGLPPAPVLVGNLSHTMPGFGCAAPIKEGCSGQQEVARGLPPRAPLGWEL